MLSSSSPPRRTGRRVFPGTALRRLSPVRLSETRNTLPRQSKETQTIVQIAGDVPHASAGVAVFPLHEDSQPILHEPVQASKDLLTVAHLKIIVPAAKDRVDLADDLLQAQRITPSDLVADLLFQGPDRLAARPVIAVVWFIRLMRT